MAAFSPRKDLGKNRIHRLIYAQVGHTVVAWLWLCEASAAQKALPAAVGADVPFYEGKIATARYFFRHELVKTRAQADLLASLETSALDVRPGHF